MAATLEIGRMASRPLEDASVRGWLGSLLIATSAAAFSTAGLFTGLIAADVWTILFWRGVFGGLFIGAYIAWRHRAATVGAFRSIGRPGLVAAACSTVATICFVHALRRTTVADVTIIYATAPLVAAAVTWLWTRERENRITLGASVLALLGVLVMFRGALTAGHLVGNLLALAMTVLIATMMVISAGTGMFRCCLPRVSRPSPVRLSSLPLPIRQV